MEPTANPAAFEDTAGRQWVIRLDFSKLRTIREKTNVDLGNIERFAQTWAVLLVNDLQAMSVIWLAIAGQNNDLSEDEWLQAMNGECLQEATDALLEGVKSFTPPRKRGMIAEGAGAVMDKYKQVIAETEAGIRLTTTEGLEAAMNQLGISEQELQASLATSTTSGT